MNVSVADPEWGWWIILYFYLGGIAAGAFFTATLIELVGSPEDRELPRVGYWIAFPLVLLCGIFLVVDLNRPERFWHMLFKSEVVKAAWGAGWPLSREGWRLMSDALLLKSWSPMSVGSWALSLFGLCSGLTFLGSLWPEGRLAWLFRHSLLARLLQVVGSLVGFFIAAYTGSLLTATNQPVWSDSAWVASLFLTSAASTGIALMIVVARRRAAVPEASLWRLEKADLWALGLELLVFAAFLASLGNDLGVVLGTFHGRLFVLGTLFVGLLLPLAIHLRLGVANPSAVLAAALFALVGGFLMRYALLRTPPELLARGPVQVSRFSPEQDRPRGEGTGADPGNRPPVLVPKSKLLSEGQP
jgi:formate-dependent nitrite reductase membrane component NrfD